jgi:hypothetical protein
MGAGDRNHERLQLERAHVINLARERGVHADCVASGGVPNGDLNSKRNRCVLRLP